MTRGRVAVVGAGWAGLAAALDALDAGFDVHVLERAPAPGGRARRIGWTLADGRAVAVDNGQHILIGAYSETLALMKRTGVDPQAALLRLPLAIEYPGGPSLRAPRWPAPLHLLAALASARGLSWAARASSIGFAARARASGWRLAKDVTVERMLADRGVHAQAVALLWEPLCLAALNTPMQQASAQVFLNVLRDSVGADRASSDLLVPKVDLSAVLPDAAWRLLGERGATLHAPAPVTAVEPSADGFAIRMTGGRGLAVDAVVLATNFADAASLLSPLAAANATVSQTVARLHALQPSAIATAWLALPEGPHWRTPMLAMRCDASRPAQWLFARHLIDPGTRLVAAVISAQARDHDREALRQALLAQVGQAIGQAGGKSSDEIAPSDSPMRIVVERAATFLCTPGLVRPATRTGVDGLVLAGDFVDSPYPGTLESAVRSGRAAASELAARRARTAPGAQARLPVQAVDQPVARSA